MEGKELRAGDLSVALGKGKEKSKFDEERSIVIRMVAGKRPEVELKGFWNGRFIRSAMDSIAKAYRVRRYEVTRPKGGRENEGGKGDVQSV